MARSRYPNRPASGPPPRATVAELLQQGLALHQSGRGAEAAPLYEQVLRREPDQPAANHLLGLVRLQSGDAGAAVALIARATRSSRTDPQIFCNLGVALNAAGRPAEALDALDRALALKPAFPGALSNRGMALRALHRFAEAAETYRRAIALAPQEPGFHLNLGNALTGEGDLLAALASYRHALQLRPAYPAATAGLASTLEALGRASEAVALLESALATAPAEAELHYQLGRARYALGDVPGAAAAYRRAIALRPTYGEAHCLLANIVRHLPDDPAIAALESTWSDESVPLDDRIFAGFGLGRALADIGAHDRSVAVFDAVNRRHRARLDFSIERACGELAAMADMFATISDPLVGAGNSAAAPIFIVGLPRSGKTSVEQLLARDPATFAGGEMRTLGRLVADLIPHAGEQRALDSLDAGRIAAIGRRYVEEMASIVPQGRTVIDTMPPNFRLVGFIRLALPGARIVHCVREPAAHRIALYEKYLTGAGYDYAYDLDELAAYQAAYGRLMAHWHALFPGAILDVDLATLAGPARIVELQRFCGLVPDIGTGAPVQSEPRLNDWPPADRAASEADQRAAWHRAHPELFS